MVCSIPAAGTLCHNEQTSNLSPRSNELPFFSSLRSRRTPVWPKRSGESSSKQRKVNVKLSRDVKGCRSGPSDSEHRFETSTSSTARKRIALIKASGSGSSHADLSRALGGIYPAVPFSNYRSASNVVRSVRLENKFEELEGALLRARIVRNKGYGDVKGQTVTIPGLLLRRVFLMTGNITRARDWMPLPELALNRGIKSDIDGESLHVRRLLRFVESENKVRWPSVILGNWTKFGRYLCCLQIYAAW